MTYLDIRWTCGGVAYSFCTVVKRLPESKKRHQDCLMSSAQSCYGPCLQSLVHWECATALHIHPTSRYVIAHDQFYQAFPSISTASNKRWGEKAWVQCWCWILMGVLKSQISLIPTREKYRRPWWPCLDSWLCLHFPIVATTINKLRGMHFFDMIAALWSALSVI